MNTFSKKILIQLYLFMFNTLDCTWANFQQFSNLGFKTRNVSII